ncbi:transcriptional regulator [Curtobacterium sp. Csp1]|uniref:transcriptional regulator n=1 Tax=Curtobacterium sp. Csp1 TaxID=2495429 RepID=UPI00159A0B46|nr:transcriptional regulator [Curtobacterium sp. Csp1]QKS18895.1 transcriptional regulator [Curtobacterium sp. Csp1]
MPDTSIDVSALKDAVGGRVEADGVSWRTAAAQIGVSPSLLTRLRNGQRPDLEAFARITRWLRIDAGRFLIDPDAAPREEPPLESEIAMLLRARRDLNDNDRDHLNSILQMGIRMVRDSRED